MSSTRVDVAELRRAREHLGREGGRIRSELRTLRTSINGVVNSTALQGNVKQAIDASMQNQHIPIINALLECYTMLERGFKDSISKWQEQVGGESHTAIMEREALNQHLQILDDNNRYFQDFDREIKRIYERINATRGPLDFRAPNNETNGYARQFATTRQHLTRTRIRDNEFDFRYTDLENLMRQTRRALGNLRSSVGRSFSGESGVRLEMANSNRGFRKLVEGITSEREGQDRAMLESLRRQWLGQNPMQSYMNLPRPLDPAVLDAWLEHHGMTMNDLNIALSGGVVNGRNSNLNPVLQWIANSGNNMRAGVNGLGIRLADRFVGSSFEALLPDGLAMLRIPHASKVGKALNNISFIWELDRDIRGGTPVGEAVVYRGTSTAVSWGVGTAVTSILKSVSAAFVTINAKGMVVITIVGTGIGWLAGQGLDWVYENVPGAQELFDWLGIPITEWEENRQENWLRPSEEIQEWSARLGAEGWAWVEIHHPHWAPGVGLGPDRTLQELYGLWQEYLQSQ